VASGRLKPDERVSVAVGMVDVVTQVSAENEKLRHLGITQDELIRMSWRNFLHSFPFSLNVLRSLRQRSKHSECSANFIGWGYRKFKLVEQATLTVLKPRTRFYVDNSGVFWIRIMTWARLRMERLKRSVCSRLGYVFPLGSSGAFGDDLESEWLECEAAKETYLFHRRDFLKSRPVNLGFWCDWHASF
jgi:hypothetical protein